MPSADHLILAHAAARQLQPLLMTPCLAAPHIHHLNVLQHARRVRSTPRHTPLTPTVVQPAGKEAAAAAAPAPAADSPSADGASEQPSTSASFIPGSVLRVHLAGEGALPDFATVREALGGRDAGIRFVEVVGEVSLCGTTGTCPHLPHTLKRGQSHAGHSHGQSHPGGHLTVLCQGWLHARQGRGSRRADSEIAWGAPLCLPAWHTPAARLVVEARMHMQPGAICVLWLSCRGRPATGVGILP